MLLIGAAISISTTTAPANSKSRQQRSGPEFRISIQGDDGTGIANMEIFCLDYALFTIGRSVEKGLGSSSTTVASSMASTRARLSPPFNLANTPLTFSEGNTSSA